MKTPEPENAPAVQSIASLNSDGTTKWFIPPYVVPAVILALVIATALFGA